MPVIAATGVSKAYAIFAKPADRLKQMLSFGRRRYYREFWALRDVSFAISRGQTIGIVGRNGSGKSTLLQIISGTLTPSSGALTVNGRVAALLELGAGFNPEFTGRENVYLNAALLGQDRAETERRFERIAAFADIGTYIDQPVKTYSSGMYARLAFSVAIHVDPDILVVDEALSVGDELFQRKCFLRIKEMQREGVTILFVSHSAATVTEICDKVLVLDRGERLLFSTARTAVRHYQRLLNAPQDKSDAIREELKALDRDIEAGAREDGHPVAAAPAATPGAAVTPAPAALGGFSEESYFDPGLVAKGAVVYAENGAAITDLEIRNVRGQRVNTIAIGEAFSYRYRVHFHRAARNVRFGFVIKSVTGVELSRGNSHGDQFGIDFVEEGTTVEVVYSFQNQFAPNLYFLNAGVVSTVDGEETMLHRIMDGCVFRSLPRRETNISGYVDCAIRPFATVEVVEADPTRAADVPDRRALGA